MWAFTRPSAGPLGARNREQVLPTVGGWCEAPTPGSASSTLKRRPGSAVRQATFGTSTMGSPASFGTSTVGFARPASAAPVTRPISAAAAATATRPISAAAAPSRPMTAESSAQARRKPAASPVSSSATIFTPSASPSSVNPSPAAAREKMATQLRAFDAASPKSGGDSVSVPCGAPSLKMRRNGTAPELDVATQGGLRDRSPERLSGQGIGARRLRHDPAIHGSVVSGDGFSQGKRHIRGSKNSAYHSRAAQERDKKNGYLNPAAAHEVDRCYQQILQEQWRRESDCSNLVASVQKRQMLQLFDFLRGPDGEQVVEDAARFVPEPLKDFDSMEADWFNGEVSRHWPELEYSDVIEFSPKQLDFLRKVLRSFALVSRPAGKVSRNVLDDGGPCADRIFRPTFARFIIDSRLVAGVGGARGGASAKFHWAVRLFDSVSGASRSGGNDQQLVQHLGPTLGVLRSVTTEQCISIIGFLIGKASNPSLALTTFFEYDLPEAWNAVQALMNQCKEKCEAALKLVTEEHYHEDEETTEKHRSELLNLFGAPPQDYNGSMKDWNRGVKMWLSTIDEQALPEAITERIEAQFAVQNYLSDMLVEPGCLHVADAYADIFKAFYESYSDEERNYYDSSDDGGLPNLGKKPHMSCAAFFRFCVDFSVFPLLGNFAEITASYRAAECLEQLPGFTPADKLKRACKTVSTMLGVVKKMHPSGSDSDSDFGEDSDHSSVVIGSCGNANVGLVPPSPSRGSSQASFGRAPIAKSASNGLRRVSGVGHDQLDRTRLMVPDKHKDDNSASTRRKSSKGLADSDMVHKGINGNASDASPMTRRSSVRRLTTDFKHAEFQATSTLRRSASELSRGPSKEAVKQEDAPEPEQEAACSEDQGPPPRQKAFIDLSWIKKQFGNMNDAERRAYALFSALNNCVADRFLCVRGLFLSCGEGGEWGLVDAEAIQRTLEKLHIEHRLSSPEVKGIIMLIDPKCEDGMIETSELEKVVGQVRTDQERRWPWLKDKDAGSKEDGTSPRSGGKRGGSTSFGYEARRTDEEDIWFNKDSKDDKVTAFGYAAFTESLLRIGLQGMHSSGTASQAAAPAGVKGLWLTAFLKYHLEQHVEATKKGSLARDLLYTKGQAAKRSEAALSRAEKVIPLTPTKFGTAPSGSGTRINISEGSGSGSTSPKVFGSTKTFSAGSCKATRQQLTENSEEIPPTGARYKWCLARFLDSHADIFTRVQEGRIKMESGDQQFIVNPSRALAVCQKCGHRRNIRGIGNIFCHECSGVDQGTLPTSLLYPVCQRRRLKVSMNSANALEAAPTFSDAGSSKSKKEENTPDSSGDSSLRSSDEDDDDSKKSGHSDDGSKKGEAMDRRASARRHSALPAPSSIIPSESGLSGSRNGSRNGSHGGSRRNSAAPGLNGDAAEEAPHRVASQEAAAAARQWQTTAARRRSRRASVM